MPCPGASEVGLELPDGLSFEDWAGLGRTVARVGNASQWWIGDWLNYGEREYGEKYHEAIEATGLAYQTLANIASVCSRIESSRRRESLSFGHHAEVGAFGVREQERWLTKAERENWTREQLRSAIAAAHRLPAIPADTRTFRLSFLAAGERFERWEVAAEHAGLEIEDWAAGVLDQAAEKLLSPESA